MRKGKRFIRKLNKKANLLCKNRDHQWEDLFDDMEQCKRCGAIKIKKLREDEDDQD